jgi:hypothetical protein
MMDRSLARLMAMMVVADMLVVVRHIWEALLEAKWTGGR